MQTNKRRQPANKNQAKKLLELTKIADVDVRASEHKTLNFSKGVIYCNDLRHIYEDTILQELKQQKVTEVKKIMKRQNPNSNSDTNNITLVETGLIIIIIKRKDNNSFDRTSPFIIKKSVDFACGGEVEGCKRTRDGNLLIKTKQKNS